MINPPRFLFRRAEIIRFVISKVKEFEDSSFMEIGAGNMLLATELLGFFKSGVAVDYSNGSKKSYAKLDSFYKSRFKLVSEDFIKANFNYKYDAVIACEILEHVEEQDRFIKKIRACVKKGGYIIISVPAKMKYWSVHDELVGHLRRYEKNNLRDLLKKNGFKEINIVSYGFPFLLGLRYLRILSVLKKSKDLGNMSTSQRTASSGFLNNGVLDSKIFSFVVNKYFFYPLTIISRFFNKYDLSEGYVVTAKK